MDFQRLALRGEGGYRQYRIPALAATKSGRLIAIYDGRADFDDLPGPVDLLIRTSDDNGSSWSPQSIFRKHQGISGFGDASIIVDPTFGEFGRVIVLYQATQSAGFFESTLGTEVDDPNISQIARSISDDDGATWKHDLITEQLKDSQTPGIFATSGMGSQLKIGKFTGRLLQTFVLRRENQLLSAIGYSDDHGDNWKLGALIPQGNETAITGLDDGTILLHSRATPYRLSAISRDGGLTIESLAPHEDLPDPSDNGSLYELTNGQIICTHNHDQDLRRKTVVKRSFNGGKTWPEAVLLEIGSSEYSTACELSDGSIGILFERNAYSEIIFCRVQNSEFQSVSYLPGEEENVDGIEFTVVPRYILPARKDVSVLPPSLNRAYVPEVNMSQFNSAERKEVGTAGGSTSGDPLFTSEELDILLGPVTPGLHMGDEIRISGRLTNNNFAPLLDVKICDSKETVIVERELLKQGVKIVFLDVRQKVTTEDLERGYVSISLSFSAKIHNMGRAVFKTTSGRSTIKLSTATGLPIED